MQRLTKRQRRALQIYQSYRYYPLATHFYWIQVLRRSSRRMYFTIYGIALLIILSRSEFFGTMAYIGIGFCVGFVVCDLFGQWKTMAAWPVVNDIIDWHKVAVLLQEPHNDTSD